MCIKMEPSQNDPNPVALNNPPKKIEWSNLHNNLKILDLVPNRWTTKGEQEKVDMDFELLQSVKKGELEVVKDLISRNAVPWRRWS